MSFLYFLEFISKSKMYSSDSPSLKGIRYLYIKYVSIHFDRLTFNEVRFSNSSLADSVKIHEAKFSLCDVLYASTIGFPAKQFFRVTNSPKLIAPRTGKPNSNIFVH